ncbi:MAG TPA: Gfo/Idh/MocA family oxidoreductase [Acidimicrobiales bacterium]|nr:Gfo/Idh/MocA family oxidoreductase [Acidimicrobiales bacterium]
MDTATAKRTIGVGLVSVGWMGRIHSQSLRRVCYHHPELGLRPRLVIAADNVAERARYAVSDLGYEQATADWREVVSHPEVELVSITAPNFLHKELALGAIGMGRHIWLEKPAGRNLAETTEIAEAARRAGVMTAVGFNYRWPPAVQRARELVAAGELGEVVHARSIFLNDYAADPNVALSWRFQREPSGFGVMGDLMSHAIDLLHFLVGPVSEVSAQARTVIAERPLPSATGDHFARVEGGALGRVENEDYAGALLRFVGGAVATCEVSRVTVGPRCQIAFDLYGSKGAVSWDFERMNELRVCLGRSGPEHGYRTVLAGPGMGDYASFQPGPAISMSYDDLKVVEAANLLRSIEQGKQEGAGIEEARAAAAVVDAVARAAESGHWEQVGAEARC